MSFPISTTAATAIFRSARRGGGALLALCCAWGVAASTSALAQERMINVSAEGEASFERALAACTIVSGYRDLAVLAEGTTSGFDAYLFAIRVDNGERNFDNDDWLFDLSVGTQDDLITAIGREPNRDTDAGNVFCVRNLALCVYGAEARPGRSGRVSVQINDATGVLRGNEACDALRLGTARGDAGPAWAFPAD
jgi:hypothetical protein